LRVCELGGAGGLGGLEERAVDGAPGCGSAIGDATPVESSAAGPAGGTIGFLGARATSFETPNRLRAPAFGRVVVGSVFIGGSSRSV
jgi:hypothetical protein